MSYFVIPFLFPPELSPFSLMDFTGGKQKTASRCDAWLLKRLTAQYY
jgi:hypothetical protein